MSCDWDVWCVDCDEAVTNFCDANHHEEAMQHLVRHRDLVAALVPLMTGAPYPQPTLQLGGYGEIDPFAFAKHAGHVLKPRDEYGRWADQCREHLKCAGTCGYNVRCKLPEGHDGEHVPGAR